jgi:hypothetical protein
LFFLEHYARMVASASLSNCTTPTWSAYRAPVGLPLEIGARNFYTCIQQGNNDLFSEVIKINCR